MRKFIIYYLSLYQKQWIVLGFCVLLTSLFPSFIPLINKLLIDNVFLDQRYDLFINIALLFSALLVIASFSSYYRHKTVQILSEKIKIDISIVLYKSIMMKKLSYFEKGKTGKLLSLFQADIPQIIRIFKDMIPTALQIAFQIIFSSVVLMFVSKVALLLVLIFLPISILVSQWFKNRIRSSSLEYQEALEDINSDLHDNLMGAKEILLYTREKENIKEMNIKFNISLRPTEKLSNDLGLSNGINFFIYWASFLVVLIVGGILTAKDTITLGSLIAMVSYFMSLFGPINFLIELYNSFQSTFGAQSRLSSVIDYEELSPEVKNKDYERIESIEFKNVSFEYDRGQKILNDINLVLEKGQMVSLIGESGVGKTTLVNLILKNIMSSKGEITFNNRSINNWDQTDLLKRISFLSQDYYLFNKTIKDNVKLANEELKEEELVYLSKKIGANPFIRKLKDQYAQKVGFNGQKLSGGQKQRIALLRALAKDYDVLILDEGTSSLDESSAQEVVNFLIELKREGKMIIQITHDLSLAAKSDVIYDLKKGSLHQYRTNRVVSNI
ncbi:ABC transporter ATP-binding protein [Bacillus sp. NTK074B]|uniref:ABC transporter ATP-binding protein n=1 Tax=Bacillus sp. NTK074B TaxID=2802174 RepID=UPI001A8E9EF6|nr:ABC transporter ATP-binding protein [Bacillus sp. NTK074B]